jgi:hypothetical protein
MSISFSKGSVAMMDLFTRRAAPLALLALGCAGNGAQQASAERPDRGSAYALVTLVWGADGPPTGYVALTDSLDVESISLEQAREFPGYTSIGVADGQLLVSPSAEDPTIERYQITSTFDWIGTGTLSFGNLGAEEVGFYRQYMAGDHSANVDVDVTGRLLWDPAGFLLEGTKSDAVLPLQRDGLDLFANFNRTQFNFDQQIIRPFSHHDQDWFRWSPDTQLVVYDTDTNEVAKVINAPCPGLDSITRDEQGRLYLSSWEYSALNPLIGNGAAPCTVRLNPDLAIDTSWDGDLTDMTQGRPVVNFRYVGGGRAIGVVLHDEEYGPDFDFSQYLQNVDDFWKDSAQFHRLWMFNIEARSGTPVQGIDAFDFINPGIFHAVQAGRIFVFVVGTDDAQTVVYELEPDGRATRRFSVPGTVTQWVSLR